MGITEEARNGKKEMCRRSAGKTEKQAEESGIGELKEEDHEDMSYGQLSESVKEMDVNVYIH